MTYAGQDQVRLVEPLDLSQLVEEMLELLKVSVSKQVSLKIDLDRNLPCVLGNAPQIRQVVMNLVINASEAIAEQAGVISVSTSRVQRGQGAIANNAASLPDAEYVLLKVSDTGRGMTEQTKAKIFDPFFTTKFAGRGLGLAVVQGIVRDHNGAVDVISGPGQGATFQILLPCTNEAFERKNVTDPSKSQQSRSGKGKILVVEDEEVLRLATSKALRRKGFSVLEARDGSVAMDLVHRDQVQLDVILLDVTLPGTSSREVFIEALRARPNVKVILSSAYDKKTVDATFTGLRIDHFIRKPFQLHELVAVLQDVLSS